MAPYCVPSDVRTLIATEKQDLEVAGIIADADIDLDDRLNGAYMNDSVKRLCSMRLAAIVIAQSQRGVYSDKPANDSIGEWQAYVDEKVLAAQTLQGKRPKVVTYTQLHKEDE